MKRIALSIGLASACTADVPETPSYQVDVMPILAANCVRCHGYPAIGGAPAHTRLDSFENVRVDDGVPRLDRCGAGTVCGTSAQAALIAARVQPGLQPALTAEVDDPGVMPPRFPLDDHQIDVLVRWQEQGAMRGAPRATNHRPEMTVEVVEQVGPTLRLAITIADADHDLVAGELYARNAMAEPSFVGPLRSGRFELDWDTSTFPERGTVALFATLDDGAGLADHELGTVELP